MNICKVISFDFVGSLVEVFISFYFLRARICSRFWFSDQIMTPKKCSHIYVKNREHCVLLKYCINLCTGMLKTSLSWIMERKFLPVAGSVRSVTSRRIFGWILLMGLSCVAAGSMMVLEAMTMLLSITDWQVTDSAWCVSIYRFTTTVACCVLHCTGLLKHWALIVVLWDS